MSDEKMREEFEHGIKASSVPYFLDRDAHGNYINHDVAEMWAEQQACAAHYERKLAIAEAHEKASDEANATLATQITELLRKLAEVQARESKLRAALKVAYNYPQVGGAYQPWMKKAEEALALPSDSTELDRLLAEAWKVPEWQPIETAPIEPFNQERWCFAHSPRLMLLERGHRMIGQYSYTQRGKGKWESSGRVCIPTHWMPLPAAPQPEKEQEK